MDIADWRRKIDELDRQLVTLISERARCAVEIGKLKQTSSLPIYEPDRERIIFNNIQRENHGPLTEVQLRQIYERLVDVMRQIQKDEMALRAGPRPARRADGDRAARLDERAKCVSGELFSMIVAMLETATEDQIQDVTDHLMRMGFAVHRTTGARQSVLAAVGKRIDFDIRDLEVLSGVEKVHRISAPYKLVGRQFRPENSVIKLGKGVEVGGPQVVVMAGPCSVESREQLFSAAEQVAKAGAKVLRGGAFKPRSSPYTFQGLGLEGLKLLREAADAHGLLVISEVMEISQIDLMMQYVDIFQVGARNMQNFNLLRELGKVRKPVLMKRGIAATIEEMLLSAEYIMSGGNYDVILCERGIRTFETYTRNTLDISAIPIVHKLSHLPITSDPSHGTGLRDKVSPMACASLAAGADALIIEVHPDPDHALSDGAQSLYPEQFAELMAKLRLIAPAVGRTI